MEFFELREAAKPGQFFAIADPQGSHLPRFFQVHDRNPCKL